MSELNKFIDYIKDFMSSQVTINVLNKEWMQKFEEEMWFYKKIILCLVIIGFSQAVFIMIHLLKLWNK